MYMKIHLEVVIRCSANLVTNNAKLKTFTLTHKCITKSEVEFPVKGSRTSPHVSSKLRVDVLQ